MSGLTCFRGDFNAAPTTRNRGLIKVSEEPISPDMTSIEMSAGQQFPPWLTRQ